MIQVPRKPQLPVVPVKTLQDRIDALEPELRAAAADVRSTHTLGSVRSIVYQLQLQSGTRGHDYLTPPQLAEGLQVLELAKKRAGQFDENGNGVVDWNEGRKGMNLSDVIAKYELQQLRESGKPAFERWAREVNQAWSELCKVTYPRSAMTDAIEYAATVAGKEPAGTDAIRWTLRRRLVEGTLSVPYKANEDTAGRDLKLLAKTRDEFDVHHSFLRLTSLGYNDVDDSEVREVLGVTDLGAYVAETRAAIASKLGMSFEDWLAGKDTAEDPQALDAARLEAYREQERG